MEASRLQALAKVAKRKASKVTEEVAAARAVALLDYQ